MKPRLLLVIALMVAFVGVPSRGIAETKLPGGEFDGILPSVPAASISTGIKDIRSFLERCPTNDVVYSKLRQDFKLRLDGNIIITPITCTEPFSAMPISQLTNQLIAMQVMRTAYYMGDGTKGFLPWTSKGLYDWMTTNVSGINFKTAPGQLYCCDNIGGELYFAQSLQDATQREYKRTWPGIASSLSFYAHEIRHADSDDPGHVVCPGDPPGGPAGCDAAYNLGQLGGYGVSYWLQSKWATGYLNIGIGCSPPDIASEYVTWNASNANGLRTTAFVSNLPPVVTPTQPYGGPCTLSRVFLPLVLRQ